MFGGAAFHLELQQGAHIAATVAQDVSTGIFKLYAYFPLTGVLTILTGLLLVVFFVTSADSATFLLAMMTSGGQENPPASKKILWGLTISITAAILLFSGGLEGLQRMAIAAAVPFTGIMLLMCLSLLRGVRYEFEHERKSEEIRTDRAVQEKKPLSS